MTEGAQGVLHDRAGGENPSIQVPSSLPGCAITQDAWTAGECRGCSPYNVPQLVSDGVSVSAVKKRLTRKKSSMVCLKPGQFASPGQRFFQAASQSLPISIDSLESGAFARNSAISLASED